MKLSQQVSKFTNTSLHLLTCSLTKTFIYVLLSGLACSSSLPQPSKSITSYTLDYRDHTFDIVEVDPKSTPLEFFLANSQGEKYRSFQKLKTNLEKQKQALIFAMNGGMYLKDGSPQGLFIQHKKIITPVDTIQKAYGNFYLQPNGIFLLEDKKASVLTTTEYLSQKLSPDFATQSGPMLVIRDTLHPVFVEGSKNIHIRNGVGVNTDGKIFFAISNNQVNLYDFAMLFKEKLRCPDALYLDGFVSNAFIPDLKRMELGGNFGVIIGIRN